MILKKPYAFLIKMFRVFHLTMAAILVYLIYVTNKILAFFNEYMYSSNVVVGKDITNDLVQNSLFVIPVIIIIISLIYLGIFYKKKKGIMFYLCTIFSFIVVIVLNAYVVNFLDVMEKSIISIKAVKLNHDLIFINMIIEVLFFIALIIRGIGINLKKVNFDSEVSNLNINEADKEEVELNINVDFNEGRRKKRKFFRLFKYIYKENKLIIKIVLFNILIIIALIILILSFKKENVEGVLYSIDKFDIEVVDTLILNENYRGEKITEDYLIAVKVNMKSDFSKVKPIVENFSLIVGESKFKITEKYNEELLDIGNFYNENYLSADLNGYVFVFSISEKYLNSEMSLVYKTVDEELKIKLDPNKQVSENIKIIKNIGEKVELEKTLGKIYFTIKDYEISDKFLIKYNYCISDEDCISSKEYLKASVDENFDKHILKLNVEYFNESDLDDSSFYDLFSTYGSIYYKKADKWYIQRVGFEEIKSKKVASNNNVYIGINSNVYNSDSIKLVFNIRQNKYEYILK